MFSDKKDKAADNLLSSGKDFADKLFGGAKDKADKLFSGQKGSAEKLFSSVKVKEKNDDTLTSPRPVPRPRSKPKEKDHGKNEEPKTLNETADSEKITADQLFESMAKSSKSVSFSDVQASRDSEKKSLESVEKTSKKERTPPKKAPRSPRNNTLNSSSPRKEKSLEESDTQQRTSEHKKRPQPPQRHHERNFSESNRSVTGYDSGSQMPSDGMELFHGRNGKDEQHQENFSGSFSLRDDNARKFRLAMGSDTMYKGQNKEGRTPRRGETPRQQAETLRWEQQEQENYGLGRNKEGYSRGKYEKKHGGNSRNDRDREENITDMFEDHEPANNGIILDDEKGRTNQHGWHRQGKLSFYIFPRFSLLHKVFRSYHFPIFHSEQKFELFSEPTLFEYHQLL